MPPVISDVPVVDGVPGAVFEVEPRGFLLLRLEVGFRRDDRLHGLGGPFVFTLDLLHRRLVAAGAFFGFTLGLRLGLRGSRRLRLRGRGRGRLRRELLLSLRSRRFRRRVRVFHRFAQGGDAPPD